MTTNFPPLCLPYQHTSLTHYINTLIQLFNTSISTVLLNKHIVQSLCIDTWSVLPTEWQTALLNTTDNIIELQTQIYNYIDITDQHTYNDIITLLPSHWPDTLKHYICSIQRLRLCRQTYNTNIQVKYPNTTKPSKKSHEIKHLTHYINTLHSNSTINTTQRTIIDIGSGQGYLCHDLTLLHNYNTLGIETRQHNIDQSYKRFHNVALRPEYKRYYNNKAAYNAYCTEMSSTTDIDTIVQQIYNTQLQYTLVGLHACGDLTNTLIDQFVHNHNATHLAVVSCCYHRITHDTTHTCMHNTTKQCKNTNTHCVGFPLSQYIKQTQYKLSQTSKSFLWNPARNSDNMVYRNNLFYIRCLFEYVLFVYYKHIYIIDPDDRIIGSTQQYIDTVIHYDNAEHSSLCDMFVQYTIYVLNKLQTQFNDIQVLSQDTLIQFFNDNEYKLKQIEWLFWLQSLVSSLIEGLIVCDRLQYIHEHGIDGTIVSVFDPLISPRNLLILAQKQSKPTTVYSTLVSRDPTECTSNDAQFDTLLYQLKQQHITNLNTPQDTTTTFEPIELTQIVQQHNNNVTHDINGLQIPTKISWYTVQDYITVAQQKQRSKVF